MGVKRGERKRQGTEKRRRQLPFAWLHEVKRDVFSLQDKTSVKNLTHLSISDETKVYRCVIIQRQRHFISSEDKI